MSKFILFVLVFCGLIACKNTPVSSPAAVSADSTAAMSPGLAPQPELELSEVEKAKADALANMQATIDIMKQIDALPAAVKQAHLPELQEIQAMMEGMSNKQSGVYGQLQGQTVDNSRYGQSGVISTGEAKDFIENTARMAALIKEKKARLEELAKGGN